MGGSVAMTQCPALTLSDVTISYDRRPTLERISGHFAPGSLTAIVGPNGAGKSTLLKAIMGDLRLTSGQIDIGSLSPHDVGYLPQAALLDRTFPLTVAETVLIGAWHDMGILGRLSRSSARRAEEALATVGLQGFASHTIDALSSGQFQRVLFARLIVQNSQIILLDEPFNAMDRRTTEDLLKVIRLWNDEGRTVIAVLHNYDQVRAMFDNTVILARRVVAWGATETVMTPDNLAQARMLSDQWEEQAPVVPSLEKAAQ